MSVQSLTLNLPEALYHRLKQRAERTNRQVEEEAVNVLTAAVPSADELPADLAEAVAVLNLLDDEALWRAARSRLAAEVAATLEELHQKRQREGLTEAETQTLASLVRQYERVMLVRAQAAALLSGRLISQRVAAPPGAAQRKPPGWAADDQLEREFLEELSRRRQADLEQTLREYEQEDRECSGSSSTPTT